MSCAPTGAGCARCWSTPPVTTALRQTVRARRDLVAHRVAVANQLRAHLQICFPARSGCSPTSTPTSPCGSSSASPPRTAGWLSPKRWAAWLSSVGYSGRTLPDTLHTRLGDAPAGTTGTAGDTAATVTAAFVAVLRTLTTQIGFCSHC